MIVWTCAVSSWDAAIQYRNGIGTDTTHWRVGTQGMTHSTRWAAVWAMRRVVSVPIPLRYWMAAGALWGTCHSPGAESHGPGCRTANRRKMHVPHTAAGLEHRGRRRVRQERSRDGRQ